MSEQGPRELTTGQAARRAGCSAEYIRRMLRQGKLRGRQPDNWVWLVDSTDLDRWIASRRHRRRAE